MIAYGIRCTWWGSSTDAIQRDAEWLCPRCGQRLATERRDSWWARVSQTPLVSDYRQFIEWCELRCFESYDSARRAYMQDYFAVAHQRMVV